MPNKVIESSPGGLGHDPSRNVRRAAPVPQKTSYRIGKRSPDEAPPAVQTRQFLRLLTSTSRTRTVRVRVAWTLGQTSVALRPGKGVG